METKPPDYFDYEASWFYGQEARESRSEIECVPNCLNNVDRPIQGLNCNSWLCDILPENILD